MDRAMLVGAVCLGVVTAWGGGASKGPMVNEPHAKLSFHVPPPSPPSTHHPSTANPKRAQEGQDFSGSVILENPGPKGGRNKFLFRWIKPGSFDMGSTPETDPERSDDENQHRVTLSHGFWLLDHELTQREYKLVMGQDKNPSWRVGDWQPVETVSWDDAMAFCKELTKRDRIKGVIRDTQEYRIPTEAEWEYAARAGTTGARYTVRGKSVKDSLDLIVWHQGNSGWRAHEVMEKAPNAWLLWDMLGNVSEWCSDWYGDYPPGAVTDPKGLDSGSIRVNRGGSWYNDARDARAANRVRCFTGDRNSALGIRPALSSVR